MVITETQAWCLGLPCAFMAMDMLTGFIGAVSSGQFSSARMREGLGHKAVLVCILVLALMIEFAADHIAGLPYAEVSLVAVAGYIIVMEVGSVLENACTYYPALKDTPLSKLFSGKDTPDA